MSYKKEAAAAHKAKCKGYAEGGGIDSGSLLDTVAEQAKQRLAEQMGGAEEESPPPEEI